MPKSKMPPSVQNLSDPEYKQWSTVYEKNKTKHGKERAAKMAWGAVHRRNESKMSLASLVINEQFPMEEQGKQDPRTITIKRQLMSLIQSTDLDDNRSVDALKAGLEQILNQL